MANQLTNATQFTRTKAGSGVFQLASEKLYVDGAAAPICIGSWVSFVGARTLHTDGSVLCDATTAADTANASGVYVAGLVVGIDDVNNIPLFDTVLQIGDSGRIHYIPARGNIFCTQYSAALALASQSGSMKLAPGAVVKQANMERPQSYTADTLSTRHATATQQAFQFVGALPIINNQDVTAVQMFEYFVNDAWLIG